MQEILKKCTEKNLSENDKRALYLAVLKSLCDPDKEYYCVLDPKRIVDGTSIPFVGKTNGTQRAYFFSKKEYADAWCEHYNVKYANKPLVGVLTFAEFFKYLAVAVVNKTAFLMVDEGQYSMEVFIPDLFNINQISFTEEIIMPRAEII